MVSWFFVTIDKKTSDKIRKKYGPSIRGFGSFPVEVAIRKTSWKISIFPDKRMGIYVLPLRAQIRKKEGIYKGDKVSFSISILE